MVYGIPQESVLGSLLFNNFSCDLFYFPEGTDIESYANNTIPSSSANITANTFKAYVKDENNYANISTTFPNCIRNVPIEGDEIMTSL